MADPSVTFKEERVSKPHSESVRWSIPFVADPFEVNRSTRAPSRLMVRWSQLEATTRQSMSSMPLREMLSTPPSRVVVCVQRLFIW